MNKLLFYCLILINTCVFGQGYTTTIDTFYVPSPEFLETLGLDSLYFPCAITKPDSGDNFPVLILIHGSSALDMDANSTKDFLDEPGAESRKAQTRMFYEIADDLSQNGIMVLRYDKRSYTVNCIEKPSCWWADTITPYDYIKDANYAVKFAKTIPGVDTCNIFVAGHSQGGSFAPDLGLKRSDIRGSISLAPTAQPVDTVVVYQTVAFDDDPIGAAIIREQFDSLRAGLWPMNDTLYNQFFSPRFWLDWISITDSAIVTQNVSTVPTLIMYGTIDQAVEAETHLDIWMEEITRENVTFQLFDELDHSFGTVYDSTMSHAVLDSLTDWIHINTADCGPIGYQLNSDIGVQYYPNPATNWLVFDGLAIGNEVKFWSMSGQLVAVLEAIENRVDISGLATGAYIVRIETEKGSDLIRILKE